MPLFWLSLALLCGLILADYIKTGWLTWAGIASLFLITTIFERRLLFHFGFFRRWRDYSRIPFCLFIACFFLGAARYDAAQPAWSPNDLAWYNSGARVKLEGIVSYPPEERDSGWLVQIDARLLSENPYEKTPVCRQVNGRLMAFLPKGMSWQYGDLIILDGKMDTPPENEDFSYKNYLAQQDIFSYMAFPNAHLIQREQGNPILSAIYQLREHGSLLIEKLYPQPEASLLNGILLGIEYSMTDDLKQAFRDTGTSHIIAISGFNIALIASFLSLFTKKIFPRKWSFILTLASIIFYTILVGGKPPVVRAAIMGGLAFLGTMLGRRQSGINSLTFVAAVMCLFSPKLLWDISFQLSFFATLGLVLYADPLQNIFSHVLSKLTKPENIQKFKGPASEYFLLTLAAQITTLPILAFHFHRISLSSFLVNILILPAQPAIMILGGLSLLGGLIIFPLGQVIGFSAWLPLAYTIRVVESAAIHFPGVVVLGEISFLLIIFYYLFIFLMPFTWQRLSQLGRLVGFPIMAASLLIIAGLTWKGVYSAPDQKFHLISFNVQGEPAYLIKTPGGRFMLIGNPSSTRQLVDQIGRRLPLFDRTLDIIILPSEKSQSPSSLQEIIERYPTRLVLWSSELSEKKTWQYFKTFLKEHHTQHAILESGQRIPLEQGAELNIYRDSSGKSALLFSWENFSLFIHNGIDRLAIEKSKPGSGTCSNTIHALSESDINNGLYLKWLESPQPMLNIFSGSVLPEMKNSNTPWIKVPYLGWVEVITDGHFVWLQSEK